MVWFQADPTAEGARRSSVFIFDLKVDERFRGNGFGTQAMLFVEGRARELGFRSTRLHVFGINRIAISLYQKLGYVATNILMSKSLGGEVTAGDPHLG